MRTVKSAAPLSARAAFLFVSVGLGSALGLTPAAADPAAPGWEQAAKPQDVRPVPQKRPKAKATKHRTTVAHKPERIRLASTEPDQVMGFARLQKLRDSYTRIAAATTRTAVSGDTASPTVGTVSPRPTSGVKPINQETAEKNPVTVLNQFVVSDLQAALADAQGQTPPDTVAANCYTALIPFVQTQPANPLPTGLGGFQLLQKGRDLKNAIANLQAGNGPLQDINIACAPLVLDLQRTLIQLGIVTGTVLATGPAGGLVLPRLLPGLFGM